jgi:hypothetical protein
VLTADPSVPSGNTTMSNSTHTDPDSWIEEANNDERPARSFRRDPDDLPTREDLLKEAREFHDEWSRRNPNAVYGQSYI